jgi:hypothetical protein
LIETTIDEHIEHLAPLTPNPFSDSRAVD